MKKLLSILLTILALTIITPPATYADGPEWLLNIPNSPIHVTLAERKNHLFFKNTTKNTVAKIRMGIVVTKNEKFRVLSKRSYVFINGLLSPGDTQFSGVSDHLNDIDSAVKRKGKLAVIYVEYVDGSVWKLNSDS